MGKAVIQTIKILTPQTSNGLLNIMDDEGRMVFRESIVPATQRKFFEKLNTQLPDNLKHRIVDVPTTPPPPPEPSALEKEVAELKAKLAEATAVKTAEPVEVIQDPAPEEIAPAPAEKKPKKNEKNESPVLS